MPLQVPYHLQGYFNLKGSKTMAKQQIACTNANNNEFWTIFPTLAV